MYDIEYNCRYNKDNIFIEFCNVTDDEKEDIRDMIYREDMMNIFYLEENDEFDSINDALLKLYDKIKNNEEFKNCMIKAAAKLLSKDEVIGLCVLYSYDFMYLTHECISDYLKNDFVQKDKIKQLKYLLNK